MGGSGSPEPVGSGGCADTAFDQLKTMHIYCTGDGGEVIQQVTAAAPERKELWQVDHWLTTELVLSHKHAAFTMTCIPYLAEIQPPTPSIMDTSREPDRHRREKECQLLLLRS